MSVHKELTKHVERINKMITEFYVLDQQREEYIEEAVELCKQGKPFDTDKINAVTARINELARQSPAHERKFVNADMVREYVSRLDSKKGQ